MKEHPMPGRRKTDIKYILRLFVLIYIPIGLLSFSSFHLRFLNEFEQTHNLLLQDQDQYLSSMERIIDLQYEKLYQDLFVLINANEMTTYQSKQTPESQQDLELLFLRIAKSKNSFDQIRFLDETGQEIIRVNNGEDEPTLVSAEQLQNKQTRYYFQETSLLKENEIYVTDMDLNIEHGEVEIPHKPMIRAATPLFDSQDKFMGIAIINYNANTLLALFEQEVQEHYDFRLHSHVLNKNGYYLFHPEPEMAFGFILDGKENNTLSIEDPLFWADIQEADQGNHLHDNQLYTFHRMTPGLNTDKFVVNNNPWILIAHTDLTQTPLLTNNIFGGLDKRDFLDLLGLAILAFILSIFIYYLKKDKRQLLLAGKIITSTHNAVLVTNHKNRILSVNEAFEKITGFKKEEVIGRFPNMFKSGKENHSFYTKMWQQLDHTGEWEGELWDQKKNGVFYPKAMRISAIREGYSNRATMYIGIFTDLTSLKQEQVATNHLQYHGQDTQLPSEQLLTRLLENNIKDRKADMFLLCFRILNNSSESLKKTESRQFLEELLSRIQMTLKPEDLIAQTGCNQFVLSPAFIHEKKHMDTYLEHFFTLCRQPISYKGETFTLKVKGGISRFPQDASNSYDLLVNGYLAMSNAFRNPNVDYRYFSHEIKNKSDYDFAIEINLQAALTNQEFHLVYQPQIELENSQVIGAEALIRWKHETMGMIPPSKFIPIAERTGFIVSLGYWIIETAFRELSEIHSELPDDFRLSINLSVLQFNDHHLLDFIIQTGATHHIDFKQIEIEITETVLMSDIDNVHRTIETFHRIGISVAIDDFGTGFSSLSYLNKLPINKLKVDRTFICHYPEMDDGKMVSIIADLARTLDLKVLMEGAETLEQIQLLRSLGYDYVQGYYYAKPLIKDDFSLYLEKTRKPPLDEKNSHR
jgi:PAS domain S-box-containing protein